MERNSLVLQLSEQTSKVASLEELLANSRSSVNVMEKSSRKFEDKVKKLNSYSEREQIFLKTIMNESREILDIIECSLETECLSMQKYVLHLQSIPDPRGEFMQLKFDGLLNETMTLLNGLGTMKSSIEIATKHIEQQILSADSASSSPPSPVTSRDESS